MPTIDQVIEVIRKLPPAKLVEVYDFATWLGERTETKSESDNAEAINEDDDAMWEATTSKHIGKLMKLSEQLQKYQTEGKLTDINSDGPELTPNDHP